MRRLVLLLCLAALGALPAGAEPPSALRQAALSADLYAAGTATGDALTVLTAARLRKALNLPAPEGDALSWQAMLETAEQLAADDPALLALIADARAEATKGVAAGPVYSRATAAATGETPAGEFAFSGGDYAEVYVEAAPGMDVNLTVRDAAGNLICADTDPSHIAYCGWTPAADGVFLLTIENRGPLPADYALMTN